MQKVILSSAERNLEMSSSYRTSQHDGHRGRNFPKQRNDYQSRKSRSLSNSRKSKYEKNSNGSRKQETSLTEQGLEFLGLSPRRGKPEPKHMVSLGMMVDHSSFDDDDDNAIRLSNSWEQKQRRPDEENSGDNRGISILGFRVGGGRNSYNDDSSFDGSSYDGSINSPTGTPDRTRMKGRKTRRRLNWRVGSFQKKTKKPPSNPKIRGDASLAGDSVAGKSVKSFHTFHSTETEVAGNKKESQEQKINAARNRQLYNEMVRDRQLNNHGITTISDDGRMAGYGSDTVAELRRYRIGNEGYIDHQRNLLNKLADAGHLRFEPFVEDQNSPKIRKSQVTPKTYEERNYTLKPGQPPLPIRNYRNLNPSPTETISTEISSLFSSSQEYDSDEEDTGTVVAIESQEEFEGNRTIGLFLFDSESSKVDSMPSTPQSYRKNMIPDTYSSPSVTNQSAGRKGLPPRTPHSYHVSPSNSNYNSERVTPKDIINNNYMPGKHHKTERHFLQKDSVYSSSHNQDFQEFKDDSDEESEGPLWQLARLQAMAEGPLESERKLPKQKSSRSIGSNMSASNDQERLLLAERNLKAIHELAEKHLQHGEYGEALDVFEEILRAQKEIHGENHYRIGTAMHNIAIVHMRARNYEKAVETCQKAVDIRQRTLGPDHPDLAVSLAQLGIAHLEIDQHIQALKAFRLALAIRRKTLEPKDPKIARLLNNIGCSLFEVGELKGATIAFEEALVIQRSMMRSSSPSNLASRNRTNNVNLVLLSIAATLCNLGSIKLRWAMYEESIVALEEALLIQQSVLGDNHPTVLNTKDSMEFVDSARLKDLGTISSNDAGVEYYKSKLKKLAFDEAEQFKSNCGLPPALSKMINFVDYIPDLSKSQLYQKFEEVMSSTETSKKKAKGEKHEEEKSIQRTDHQRTDHQRRNVRDAPGHDLHWI